MFLFPSNACSAVDSYNDAIGRVLDDHCPVSTRTRKQRPCVPWYDAKVHEARQQRRKLERKWRKSQALCDRELYIKQKNFVTLVIQTAKRRFYTDTFLTSNPKSLYTTLNSLLGTGSQQSPCQVDDNLKLSNDFADYFDDKIAKIRLSLEKSAPSANASPVIVPVRSTSLDSSENITSLTEFDHVSDSEIRGIVKRAATKSCDLDPLPTWLLKECVDVFLPAISQIVNTSISSGVFPDKLKKAIIFPSLKKQTLDHEVVKNYRPVSNIAFMSKVIELAVFTRLSSYLRDFDLQEDFQSAYKKFYSTETALLRVKQDILQDIDQKKAVLLVLLDLSSAFDTLDHSILLARLQTDYGIQDTALQWLKSYLTGRTSRVSVKAKYSKPHTLKYGVPQGSVLGPLLFTMYIRPVGDILKRHGLRYHLYADDMQIYCSFDPRNPASLNEARSKLEKCVCELSQWLASNMLKLNEDKTEILVVSSSRLRPTGDMSLHIRCI